MVPVGKIVRAHGIKGSVKVYPYGDTLQSTKKGDKLFLEFDSQPVTLSKIQRQKNCWIVTFEEVCDRNAAERLVGNEIWVPEEHLPKLGPNEYYYYQLIGMKVQNTDGRDLGVLRHIIETGANDVYVVESHDGEILIPALDHVVLKVDIQRNLMVVNPPEGLIEDDN